MAIAWFILLLPVVLARPKNYSVTCQDGLILPAWIPKTNLTVEIIWMRGTLYFLALGYIFLGVSIISDRFMSAIEKITSQERFFYIPKKSGGMTKVFVRVWNETVANLTLMALGSSCPEIMLSVIEIYAKHYEAGELGPGTIVGSAAYNLFGIMALCVMVIPKGQTRKIKRLGVFFVTATWSVFAYMWLYFILAVSSEGIVEVWEAVMTFMFFPVTVLTAYIADKYAERKEARAEKHEVRDEVLGDTLEQARLDYSDILKDLKSRNPLKKMNELEWMAEEVILSSGPKSRAYYRVMAIKNLTSDNNYRHTSKETAYPTAFGTTYFRFEYATYTVIENIGVVDISVVVEGADLKEYVVMEYQTEDGTAKQGLDYIAASGILVFRPGEKKKCIPVEIIDDFLYEMDEYFFIRLINVKSQNPLNKLVKLVKPEVAKIVILDDDHAGFFMFEEEIYDVSEKEGVYDLPVIRSGGSRGVVRVPYRTLDGTAEAGIDYIESSGHVVFENDVTR